MNNILVELEKRSFFIRREVFGADSNDVLDFVNIHTYLPKLTFVNAPFSNNIDGIIFKFDTERSIIAINSTKSIGEYNFILGHELYHHFYSKQGTTICSTDEFDLKKSKTEETIANIFSLFLLMPFPSVEKFISVNCNGIINKESVVKMCNYFRVSLPALIMRLYLLDYLSETEAGNMLKEDYTSIINECPSENVFKKLDSRYSVDGDYKKLAKLLLDKDKITDEKYSELLNVFEDSE